MSHSVWGKEFQYSAITVDILKGIYLCMANSCKRIAWIAALVQAHFFRHLFPCYRVLL